LIFEVCLQFFVRNVMLLCAIRSIFLLWILRFRGLKVIAPPGGYSWI